MMDREELRDGGKGCDRRQSLLGTGCQWPDCQPPFCTQILPGVNMWGGRRGAKGPGLLWQPVLDLRCLNLRQNS